MVAITFDPAPLASDPGRERPHLKIVTNPPSRRHPVASALAAVAAVVVAAALTYLALTPDLAEPGTVAVTDVAYTAVAGDTMWSIARDQAPAGETATYVERLVAANGTSTVAPGQHIVLPRS